MSVVDEIYLQYGCAYTAPLGWVNFDASLTLRAERLPLVGRFVRRNPTRFPSNVRYGDIIGGLPIKEGSCAGIYCSHVLEHLTLEEARLALRNTLKMLRPGGTFRIVVPDLRSAATAYLSNSDSDAAIQFMRATLLGQEEAPKKLLDRIARIFGRSMHLWMWDFLSLSAELESVGFKSIRRGSFNDSLDPMFKLVEESSRFLDAVVIECKKEV